MGCGLNFDSAAKLSVVRSHLLVGNQENIRETPHNPDILILVLLQILRLQIILVHIFLERTLHFV